MKIIMDLVDNINEEIDGAKEYAEKYLELKSDGDSNWAAKFKEMSTAELTHATTLHDFAVQKITQLKTVYTAPVEMQEVWDNSHKHYIERVAWIKQMLAM